MSAHSELVYPPLGSARHSFRLLRVLLSRSCTSPIQCELFAADLQNHVDTFTALSYVWGPPEPSYVITVNGATLVVRKNLRHFLEAIRPRRKSRVVWTDAVCINQQDVGERSSQVQMMGDIYANAKMVYSFLGHDQHTEAILKSIKSNWLLHRYNQETTRISWNELSQVDYWTRLWIVQEFTLAKKICFVAGHTTMPFSYNDYWSAKHGKTSHKLYPSLHRRRQGASAESRTMAGMMDDHQSGLQKAYDDNFEDFFDLYGTLHCALPQDRVFALLCLLMQSSRERIHGEDSTQLAKLIDYTVSPYDLLWNILQFQHLLLSEPLRFIWQYKLNVIQGSQDVGRMKRIRLEFCPMVQLSLYFRKLNFLDASCENARFTVFQYSWSNDMPRHYVLVKRLRRRSRHTHAKAVRYLAHTCVLVQSCGGECERGCKGHTIIGFAQVYTTAHYDRPPFYVRDAHFCDEDDLRMKIHPGKYLERLVQMVTLPVLPSSLEGAPSLFHAGSQGVDRNRSSTCPRYWLSTTVDSLVRLSTAAVKIEDAFLRTYTNVF
ncbi:uncharacterized protein EKO05_0007923 [Ascochyta rabiei]|uniref:uncharacterized protein n=1 Tax=Didymella rabiei TaxID=5454 RepID=UPI00220DC752|nr:uncharacterized protein EKO05_0007923 [Ascochyta rabiei]UPX17578.1 hypothetical protein EKO05_0007923 [Ascochyta rabiei]